MTDNEIVKALEFCANSDDCNVCSCPFYLDDDCDGHCREVGMRYALDLINRQKAEIERLTDMLNATINGQETLQRYVKTAKAEAIKEFAERLKKHSYFDDGDQRKVVAEAIIDHYLKEMVGDAK